MGIPKNSNVAQLAANLDMLVDLFGLPDVRSALYAKNMFLELRTRNAAIGGAAQCMVRVRIFKRIGIRCLYWKRLVYDAEFTARLDGCFDIWEQRCQRPSVVQLSEIVAWLTFLLEIPEKQKGLELLVQRPTPFHVLRRIMAYVNSHACDRKGLRVNTWLLGYAKFGDAIEIEINPVFCLFGRLETVGDTESLEITVSHSNALIITGCTRHSVKIMPSEFEAWWNAKVNE